MNILFIGSPYLNSTSRGIAGVITKDSRVNNAGFMDSFNFVRKYCQMYVNKNIDMHYKDRIPVPLSFYWKVALPHVKFDVVFVEQNGFNFINDIGIPVIYYHRDIPTPLFMKDMNILLYRFKAMERKIAEENPEIWNNGIYKKRFLNAVQVENFESDLPKIYDGINWIGWQKPLEYYWKIPDQKEYYTYVGKILDFARRNFLINYHPHGIKYTEATQILKQSEAVLIIPGNEAYVTRKIYEAAAAKSLIVLWVQNKEAMVIFSELGLMDGINCLMWSRSYELKKLAQTLNEYDKEDIINEAYNWVKSNHTWAHRAHELIEICAKNGIK